LIFENYIICQNFNASKFQNINFEILKLFIENENENISNISNISSILNYDIPYYFITKITDIMIIIGQQQLETINMLINTFKSKDKEEKIELIRKKNIQKSIEWCELYKVPCRIDKTNIFNLSCIENKL
jgi:lysyl-tRNA synthetase class I